MGDDRKRKQRSSSSSSHSRSSAIVDARAVAAAATSSSSSDSASDAVVRHAKFYAIAAITDPQSPPRRRTDGGAAMAERLRLPVTSPAPTSDVAQLLTHSQQQQRDRPVTDMSILPRSVMELVYSFAVKDLSLKLTPATCRGWKRVRREKIAIDRLAHWRSVCTYWREVIDDIVIQFQQRRLKVNLSYKTHDQVLAAAATVVDRGDQLVDLRIALYGYYDVRDGLAAATAIPWSDMLRHCPNLQRLDLSEIAFLSRTHMGDILDAAAQHCLKLQALIFPLPCTYSKYDRVYSRVLPHHLLHPLVPQTDIVPSLLSVPTLTFDDDVLQHKLARALARWFTRGRRAGLRQLTIASTIWTSDAFVQAIVSHCPQIEVLDGWKLTYLSDGWGPVTCDDEWQVQEPTWRAFCQTCTRLRAFNWAVVPFTDAFFRPFGATPKPLLTELLLDFADSFGAEPTVDNAAEVGGGTVWATAAAQQQQLLPPFAGPAPAPPPLPQAPADYVDLVKPYSSDGLCALVRGLPFLTKLQVTLHPTTRIDVDVFDDAFLLELTTATRYLEVLRIVEAGRYDGMDAITTVSETGLEALARMRTLSDVTIAALDCVSADAVLAFMRSDDTSATATTTGSRQRNVKLGVLRGLGMCIIDILKTLAKDVRGETRDASPYNGATKPFAVVLENVAFYRNNASAFMDGRDDDGKTVKRVEDKLRSLHARLAHLHPRLKCQLTLAREPTAVTGRNIPTSARHSSGKSDVPRYRIAKFALFSSTWSFPDALGGTFYRGDIAYDGRARDATDGTEQQHPFEMIVRVG